MNKEIKFDSIKLENNMEHSFELQSKVIDWLRFPMILLVVYIHYYGDNIPQTNIVGCCIYDSIRITISHVISRAAVPIFFLISGYYFFYNTDSFNYKIYIKKLRKRVNTILIPYLIWNGIFILQIVIKKIAAWIVKGKPLNSIIDYFNDNGWINMLWNCNTWPGRIDWLGYLHENTAPILIPMWYLRDLIVFFILTPIIFICIKKAKQYILIILAISYVSNIWPQIPGFSSSIIFFVIGAYFAINKKNIIIECYRYHKHIFIITILLLPLMIILDGQFTQYGNIIYPFFILVLVPFYINTTSFLMQKDIISPTPQLSKVSFFIYASHVFILDYCAKLLKIILPSNIWYISTIRYILIPILCIITCYILYIIMRKITPKLLVYLTGNRQ